MHSNYKPEMISPKGDWSKNCPSWGVILGVLHTSCR